MKKLRKALLLAAILAVVLFPAAKGALAQAGEDTEDKTLSPYFLVTSEDADLDRFALESTYAEVDIAGVIADVTVTQVYKNDGKKPIEAIYVFPASTRAAVYGMKMTIGERTIVARIEERQKARQEYEKAKEAGKSASLLEQQRPNVFQMNVANILPGDVIKVELKYTELLVPTNGVYEFAYPTVVGPRYSNVSGNEVPGSENWVENPYLHEGEKAPYDFDINVNISAGLPLKEVNSTSHKVNVEYESKSLAGITLDTSEKSGGNRDFILKYRLAGGKIQSGLLLYEGERENFFLLNVQPPERVDTEEIPPREYIFIVDVSGSMRGFPLDVSKKLLKDLIGNLRKDDMFNVLLFAGGSQLMSEESVPAGRENIDKAIDFIDRQHGGGGTELLPALERALALPGVEDVSRTVVIVTDGYVRVEKEAFDLVRNNLGKANMFTFGIGSSVNRFLLEGMARAGTGEPFIVTGPAEAPQKARRFREIIQSPVLTNIKVDFGRFDVYEVEPPSVPDVLAERPVVIFGKYKGRPRGTITVKGMSGKGDYKQSFAVARVRPMEENSAIRYLWARKRIQVLDDYNNLDKDDNRVKEVTELGLTYNLLTAYTSFVAIDSEARLTDGKAHTVKQPLPLPQGVSDAAVGQASMGGARKVYRSIKPKSPAAEEKSAESSWGWSTGSKLDKDSDDAEAPAIEIKSIRIQGDMAEGDVEKMFDKQKAGLEKCRSAAIKTGADASGRLKIRATIGPAGNVDKVTIEYNHSLDPELAKCVTEIIEKWNFRTASAGKGNTVTFVIVFK